jgi:hypothetical protein
MARRSLAPNRCATRPSITSACAARVLFSPNLNLTRRSYEPAAGCPNEDSNLKMWRGDLGKTARIPRSSEKIHRLLVVLVVHFLLD